MDDNEMALEDVTAPAPDTDDAPEAPESERRLVKTIQERIRCDKQHHKAAFDQMRRDMFLVKHGRRKVDPEAHYKANLCGRHVKQKTASLYAKNPKAVARRRETLDYAVWDEKPQSLLMAFQTVQMGQQMLAAAPPMMDEMGQPMAPPVAPEMEAAFQQAMAIVQDFQQGTERRKTLDRIGKTMSVLFAQAMREQKPVDFKTGMKQCVRRACTTGVGYVELGFQRQTGPRPGLTEQLADARQRLDHLTALAEDVAEGEIEADDPEMAELQASVMALQAEPEIVLREGLVFDFPQSTKVIPDKLTKQLIGFVGARHLTVEYIFTCDQVEELFGVDLGKKYTGYTADGVLPGVASANMVRPDNEDASDAYPSSNGDLVCVWKHYDKTSGLCYYVADGYDKFLRPAAAPDVFVEDFWPVYALTFNAIESEDELFPPSDVFLMTDQQVEYNKARQGQAEHRYAARPRWVYQNGALEDGDIEAFVQQKPFTAQGLNLPQGAKVGDILQAIPVPGVDPNLYETGQIFSDIQLTVGTNEAQMGGVAQATATESAIAASSIKSSDNASIDDLDGFLSIVARGGGQILLKEMSEEQVKAIAGPGALWPQATLSEITAELYLEVEAGSSGKPNQAVETQNFKELAPLLMQIPGVKPDALAREGIKRLDDRLDLTEFVDDGIPAIVAQNRMQQVAPPDPQADPQAQGAEGGNNGPAAPPDQQQGSQPAFGSNQV